MSGLAGAQDVQGKGPPSRGQHSAWYQRTHACLSSKYYAFQARLWALCTHSTDREAKAPWPHITWAASVVELAPPTPRPTAHLFVPDLQGLAADAVEDGEKAALKRVLEHLASRGPAAALGPGLEIGTERQERVGAAGPKEGR